MLIVIKRGGFDLRAKEQNAWADCQENDLTTKAFHFNSVPRRCLHAVARVAAALCAARSDSRGPAQTVTSRPADSAFRGVAARPSIQYRNLHAARARQRRAATDPTSKSAPAEYGCIAGSLRNLSSTTSVGRCRRVKDQRRSGIRTSPKESSKASRPSRSQKQEIVSWPSGALRSRWP